MRDQLWHDPAGESVEQHRESDDHQGRPQRSARRLEEYDHSNACREKVEEYRGAGSHRELIEEDEEIGNVRLGDLESEKKINEIFGGLALGLGQAGSCVELNGISMVCYLKLYDSSGNKLLGEKDEARDYP